MSDADRYGWTRPDQIVVVKRKEKPPPPPRR